MALMEEVARLRSWEEPLRTTAFASAYFLGWNSRVGIGAFLLCFLSALVLSPPFRTFAFPPRPPALSPAAPTLSPSELAESEATAFADEVSQLAASPTSEPPLSVEDLLDPVPVEEETKKEDKARVTKLAKHGLPIQRFAGDVADGWERWANALEPTSPFPTHEARIKVALYLLPVALALAVVPTAMIVSALTAVAGLAFFGDPMLRLGIRLLDQHAGSWREAVEIQHSILARVPSNAQLTITLFRTAEASGTPLPPPPLPLTPASSPAPVPPAPTRNESDATSVPSPRKDRDGKKKLAAFVRTAARMTEEGAGYVSGQKSFDWEKVSRLAVDKLKSTTGSALPEHLMAVVPRSPAAADERSNSTFYAHHTSKPGHLLLRPSSTIPSATPTPLTTLSFLPVGAASPDPILIPLERITSLRKTAGLGWKGRLAAGWVMGGGNVGDGIEVRWFVPALANEGENEGGERTEGEGGERVEKFAAIVRRDELFNRLAGLAETRWESV